MLITLLVAIVVLALVLYVIQLLPLDATLTRILQIVIVVAVIIWLVTRFGGAAI
jgi:hypothetical protein